MNKGLSFELENSIKLHKFGIPLLISPSLLRSIDCGQVDIGRYYQGSLQLFEVKSSPFVSAKQKRRLYKTRQFIAEIFNKNVYLYFIAPNICQKI